VDAQVTREPVDRELRRRQLAKRLVVHQARTQTIFALTGLSKHQLATLRQRWRVTQEMRHRGPAPRSFAVFWSTLRLRSEAASLAVFWRVLGSMGAADVSNHIKFSAVEFGERLCDVFEIYLACFPQSELELEHLALLARGLDQGDAIAISNCTRCEAVILSDLLGMRRHICSHCQQTAATAAANPSEPAGSKDQSGSADRTDGAVQQELF
jgi:hypothetical protein